MISDQIAGFAGHQSELDAIAPSGWILGFNYTWSGPESMYVGYSTAWRAEYEELNYGVGDPVLLWAMMKNRGYTRWSEINIPDLRKVMAKAKAHGINYGAAFARRVGVKKSFLTMARPDREFTDTELVVWDARFNGWVDALMNRATLTDPELEVLRAYRDGLSESEAAARIGVSKSAVKQRFMRACSKLGASNRTHAVVIAVQRNYL